MYSRVTTLRIDASKIGEIQQLVPPMSEQLKAIDGMISAQLAWSDLGDCMVMAVYDTKEQADSASEPLKAVWAMVQHLIVSPPEAREYANTVKLR